MKCDVICSKLIDEAQNSPIQYRLASAIIQNGKILFGPKCNSNRNFYRGLYCGSIHAEANVMLGYFGTSIDYDRKKGWFFLRKDKKQKLDIYVVRINNSNELLNARPCCHCLEMMKSLGIKRVYYSVSDTIKCELVKDMVSIQSSNVAKKLYMIQNNIIDEISDDKYFEIILIKRLPTFMKKINFQYFLSYNLNLILPTYKVRTIGHREGFEKVGIINEENIIVKHVFIY